VYGHLKRITADDAGTSRSGPSAAQSVLLALGAALVVAFVNWYGVHLIAYLWGHVSEDLHGRSPSFGGVQFGLIYIALCLVGLLGCNYQLIAGTARRLQQHLAGPRSRRLVRAEPVGEAERWR
jgi:hypothetical protein